jgi:hypothetical protein
VPSRRNIRREARNNSSEIGLDAEPNFPKRGNSLLAARLALDATRPRTDALRGWRATLLFTGTNLSRQ